MSAHSQQNHTPALVVLTTLFFMMGFITCMNDILIPHLKDIFDLTYVQAMLIQFCFFTAYAIMSIPMGYLVGKIGYKNGVISGFVLTAIGCLLFYPAAGSHSYATFLGALFILAVFVKMIRLPDANKIAEEESEHNHDGKHSVWQYRHLVFGAAGIFCYVGAEVSIGSLLVSVLGYLKGLDHASAAKYLSFYWGGAMVGRFLGSAIMAKIAPNRYLAFNATAAVALLGVAMLAGKASADIAMWALLAIGFFNSIMFPTIFSLATKGLGRFTSSASGVLCTAIVGGAVVPVVQGWAADTYGLMISFVVSAICYVYIVFFAIKGYKADE